MLYIDRWKLIVIAVICLLGFVYASPNVFQSRDSADNAGDLPFYVPYHSVNLGLDLRGGSYLLLKVESDVVVQERIDSLQDVVRSALREAKVRRRNMSVDGNSVTFDLIDPTRVDEVRRLIRDEDPSLEVTAEGGQIRLALNEDDLRDLRHSAVTQSIEIIRRRIDETGTREPLIQRQGLDRIIVQLPGVDNPQRMKDVIGKTAKLTFWVFGYLFALCFCNLWRFRLNLCRRLLRLAGLTLVI